MSVAAITPGTADSERFGPTASSSSDDVVGIERTRARRTHSFLKAFSAFLLFLLVFFTPWSAINLVDYYWVTSERYECPPCSTQRPLRTMERRRHRGVCVWRAVQMPFVSTGFYTGHGSARLGVDISWIVG